MQLIYRGQHFHSQPATLHLTTAGTIQTRTFIYRGNTYSCNVLVSNQLRQPRALNWRFDVSQRSSATQLAPVL